MQWLHLLFEFIAGDVQGWPRAPIRGQPFPTSFPKSPATLSVGEKGLEQCISNINSKDRATEAARDRQGSRTSLVLVAARQR
jgi:hypothetical protein